MQRHHKAQQQHEFLLLQQLGELHLLMPLLALMAGHVGQQERDQRRDDEQCARHPYRRAPVIADYRTRQRRHNRERKRARHAYRPERPTTQRLQHNRVVHGLQSGKEKRIRQHRKQQIPERRADKITEHQYRRRDIHQPEHGVLAPSAVAQSAPHGLRDQRDQRRRGHQYAYLAVGKSLRAEVFGDVVLIYACNRIVRGHRRRDLDRIFHRMRLHAKSSSYFIIFGWKLKVRSSYYGCLAKIYV